jgi:hypothetical protein
MTQLFFLLYLFLLGLCFGLCFKKWIPINFIVFGSFLWGSIIYAFFQYIFNMFRITINLQLILITLSVLLILTFIFCVKSWDKGLERNEWFTIIFTILNFTLLNLVFIKFNYSLATYDSYTFINLARSIGFDGFSNNVVKTLLSWGGLIPIIQSVSLYLGFDYLVSLQFSFSFSFITLFFIISKKTSYDITSNKTFSTIISILSTVLLISTPLIIVQLFYIHSNLTTAVFIFLAVYCGWMALKEENDIWFVFFNLSLIGLNLSRTETFIYSLVIIFLLISSNKLSLLQKLYAFLPTLLIQTVWFVYLFFRSINDSPIFNLEITELLNGTKDLNPQKLEIMILFMLVIIGIILLSSLDFVSKKILPILNKYFLSLIVFSMLILLAIKPMHMLISLRWYFVNLYNQGAWGGAFWLITIILGILLLCKRNPIENYFMNILIGISIVIIDLSFLRNPFRMGWSDSANRLMTFGIPIGFLLLTIIVSNWLNKLPVSNDKEVVQIDQVAT